MQTMQKGKLDMNPLIVVPPLAVVEGAFTQYELPPEGISLLGYVVRRWHKTELLGQLPQLLAQGGETKQRLALLQVAHYAAASLVTFGSLFYEPVLDAVGSRRMEADPQTGAEVTAVLESIHPAQVCYTEVALPWGGWVHGRETTQHNQVNLHGWIHSVTCDLDFYHPTPHFTSHIRGNLIREIVPRLAGPWHMRAHGTLELQDNAGHVGRLILRRDATATVLITNESGELWQQNLSLY
jgi:hypothetical protein